MERWQRDYGHVLEDFKDFDAHVNTVLSGCVGSLAHGTYVPKDDPNSIDDIDVMGVCIPPKSYYLGLDNFEQIVRQQGEWDIVIYEIRKFVKLLLKNNPNVLQMLWLPANCYIHVRLGGSMLCDNRDIFLSQECRKSFSVYAYAQLQKMDHNVDEFGYDSKKAAHMIRFLKMGREALLDGVLNVYRDKDGDEIKAIKSGKWALADIKVYAETLFEDLDKAVSRSVLPPKPDYKRANELLQQIVDLHLKECEA